VSHDELIAKARAHAEAFERGGEFPVRVADLPRARVIEAALIYFGSNDGDDVIEVLLDSKSGDFITARYSPPLSDTGPEKK
jgi:hypothetical protein